MSYTTGRDHFYKRQVISNLEFDANSPTFSYGFTAQHLILVNDGKFPIAFSFNGCDLDGEVFRCDKYLVLSWKGHSKIWLKTESEDPGVQVRIWAWIE